MWESLLTLQMIGVTAMVLVYVYLWITNQSPKAYRLFAVIAWCFIGVLILLIILGRMAS